MLHLRTFTLCLLFVQLGCASNSGKFDINEWQKTSALHSKVIQTNPFQIFTLQKHTAINQPIRVYIEGDGFAYRDSSTPSTDPTPHTPTALLLAEQDLSPNVVYLARPCQYLARDVQKVCQSRKWWTTHRFDSTSLNSLSQALDSLKQTPSQTFELVGFSGGGTHAMLLAATRTDVLNIRTVAGNFDPNTIHTYHNAPPLPHALSPLNFAAKLARIPQIHFLGEKDKIIPPHLFQTYTSALPLATCEQHKIVSNTQHNKGWPQQWQTLLKLKPSCYK